MATVLIPCTGIVPRLSRRDETCKGGDAHGGTDTEMSARGIVLVWESLEVQCDARLEWISDLIDEAVW